MKRFGLVLSGGGAKGFAHLGMLQYFEEMGLKFQAVSGTSAGAIVGAFYASGMKPLDIHLSLRTLKAFSWNNLLFKKSGVFSMKMLEDAVLKAVPENQFEALQLQLFVTATDIQNNTAITFSSGQLAKAVVASSSIPVAFQPVSFSDNLLIDGGLLNNFPIEPLKETCDVIIGSHLNRIQNKVSADISNNPLKLFERCFHMAIAETVYPKAKHCDLFIDHDLAGFTIFDLKKADQIFESGYEQTKKWKDEILRLMEE